MPLIVTTPTCPTLTGNCSTSFRVGAIVRAMQLRGNILVPEFRLLKIILSSKRIIA